MNPTYLTFQNTDPRRAPLILFKIHTSCFRPILLAQRQAKSLQITVQNPSDNTRVSLIKFFTYLCVYFLFNLWPEPFDLLSGATSFRFKRNPASNAGAYNSGHLLRKKYGEYELSFVLHSFFHNLFCFKTFKDFYKVTS